MPALLTIQVSRSSSELYAVRTGLCILSLMMAATSSLAQEGSPSRVVGPPSVRPTAETPPPDGPSLLELTDDLGGGADSEPVDPPAPIGGRGFGPPPPPRLALDGWFIGPSGLGSGDSSITMGFVGVGTGKRFTFKRTMLGVRPQFQALFFETTGSRAPVLPEQLYGLSVDFQVEQPFSRKFSLLVGATPGLYTDFENLSEEAVRVPARMFATYVFGPRLVVLGGVVYTAQPDLPIIPAAGLIWTPSKRWRWELIAPRPRVVFNVRDDLLFYGQFSFDSSTYAFRALGRDDLLQYRDLRVAMGSEWTSRRKVRVFGEVGAAFTRSLDLGLDADRNVEPGVFLRTGLRY